MSIAGYPQINHLLGKVTLAAPTAGGVERGATTGTPDVVIGGRIFDVTAKASGAVDKTDSITGKAAPTLKKGDRLLVVHTVGVTEGDASTAPAIEHHTLFSSIGGKDVGPELPVHIDVRHCPFAYEAFENNGDADFTYGVTNFAASSASGVKHKRYSVAHQAVQYDWINF